jgi:hypothetical protein
VKDLKTEEERLAFQSAFGKLLDRFTASGEKPRAVVRGVFWPNEAKDICMGNAARDHAIPFVKADFAGDPAMKAIGLFAHAGVANHPGDGGMAAIANAILKTLFPDAFATKEKTRNVAEKKSACKSGRNHRCEN